jgi:flavodoxin
MKRILVVYYSRTGRTRQIAEAIAGRLGADIECVQDVVNRSGVWGYLRSLQEALQQRVVHVETPLKDPSGYDLVILGTPVWAHNICSPMRSYITEQKAKFRAIAVFCTQGGSGAAKVIGQVAKLCGRSPLATLVLNVSEIKTDQFAAKLDAFVRAVALVQAA